MKIHEPKLAGMLTAANFDEHGKRVCVYINPTGGVLECMCMFQNAFTRIEDGFLVVYTEHCGHHSFRVTDDLYFWELP